MARLKHRRPTVRYPTSLCGEFTLVEYDRDTDAYSLTLDDHDHSNYNIGSSPALLVRLFAAWGYAHEGAELIDRAREFRAAILRHAERTVIAIPRSPVKTPDLFEEKSHAFVNL